MGYLSAHISLLQRSEMKPPLSPWHIQQTRWNIGKLSTAQIESCACIRSCIPIGSTLAHKSYSSNNLIWVISLDQSSKQANRPTEVWTEQLHCCTWHKNLPLTEYQRPVYSSSPNRTVVTASICLWLHTDLVCSWWDEGELSYCFIKIITFEPKGAAVNKTWLFSNM